MAAVSVSARLRPPTHSPGHPAASVDDSGLLTVNGRQFGGFLAAVVTGSDQSVAYDAVCAPLLEKLHSGYSCTLLAYGQTGSGKTHAIFGPPGSLTEASLSGPLDRYGVPPSWGLFPRMALALLRSGADVALHASAVEIYSEHAFDLLADRSPLSVGARKAGRSVGGGPTCCTTCGSGPATSAAARERNADAALHGVHPKGCRCGKCFLAQKAELAARLAKRDAMQTKGGGQGGGGGGGGSSSASGSRGGAGTGERQQEQLPPEEQEEVGTVGETRVELRTAADIATLACTVELTRVATGHLLNARSSRSHCFVHLHLTERRDGGATLVRRQLVCVDLAGSERILKSGVEGLAQRQAVGINASLTALGKVVRAVGEHSLHVPYRDSTLTQMLRSSLGGRSCTSVLIALASDAEHADETLCSVEFGRRMASVRNRATVVAGTDALSEKHNVTGMIEAARAELRGLEAAGHGERFGAGAEPTSVAGFKENVRRKAEEDAKALEARSRLAELKGALSSGGGGERGAGAVQAAALLLTRAEAAEAESANLRDIIMRQKSIKGFWIAPKASYTKKLAEVKALEARLAMLGLETHESRRQA